MTKNLLLTIFISFYSLSNYAQSYFEDFESFNEGDYIGEVSDHWTTWSGATGNDEDAKVVTTKAKSGDNSIYFQSIGPNGGPQDLILSFGDKYESGLFTLTYSIFVLENAEAYMNIQAETTPGQAWASNTYFSSDGIITIDGESETRTLINQGEWNDIVLICNLDSDVWTIMVNGECAGSFISSSSIASLDIFPIAQTSNLSEFWIDDIGYTYLETTPPITTELALLYSGSNFGITGTEGSVSGTIYNAGDSKYSDVITVTAATQNNTITETLEGVEIEPGAVYDFQLENLFTLEEGINEYTLSFDAPGDLYDCNNVSNSLVTGFTPADNKRILSEEATGTWCQWCPRGAVFMERMEETFNDRFVGVAIHSGDPMEISPYSTWLTTQLGTDYGYPSVIIDRDVILDPSQLPDAVIQSLQIPAKSFFDIQAQYNEDTKEAVVKAVVNASEKILKNHKLVVALVEDEVTGTSNGYAQENAYSGGTTAMGGYENLPNPVPASQMVYHDVARALLTEAEGMPLVNTIKAGEYEAYEFTFTTDADWNLDHVRIVVFLVDALGNVDNSKDALWSDAINAYVPTNEVSYLQSIDLYPNPTSGSAIIDIELKETSNVTLSIYNQIGQKVAFRNYGNLQGNQLLNLNNSSLPNGNYMITLSINGQITTQKMILNR